jgi:hypothetical protein
MNAAAWDALTEDSDTAGKQKVLMAATARLEMERWRGRISSLSQRLAWPRYSLYDTNGRYILSGVIPAEIKNMTCELALHLLNQGTADTLAPDPLRQFEHLKVGPVDLTPAAEVTPPWQLPPAALRWGGRFLRSSRAPRVERG